MRPTTDEMKLFPDKFVDELPKALVRMRRRYGAPKQAVKCGECAHLIARLYDKAYFKCTLHSMSKSASSDFRKSWPGCGAFEAR